MSHTVPPLVQTGHDSCPGVGPISVCTKFCEQEEREMVSLVSHNCELLKGRVGVLFCFVQSLAQGLEGQAMLVELNKNKGSVV